MLSLRSLLAFAFLLLVLPAGAQTIPDVVGPVSVSTGPSVSVQGMVKNPGTFPWKPGMHVLELLAASGGLTLPPEDVRAEVITEGGQKTVPIGLTILLNVTNSNQNLPLKAGDILMLTQAEMGYVNVTGEVVRPGPYYISQNGVAVSTLLLLAGGPTPDAALSRVQIEHENQVKTYDLRPLPESGTQNMLLFMGDTLLVPTLGRVAIVGEVKHPGEYSMPDGEPLTVAQALTMVGGLTSDAADGKVSISRSSGAKRSDFAPTDMKDVLRAGDILTVPSKAAPKLRTRPDDEKVRMWLIAGKSGTHDD